MFSQTGLAFPNGLALRAQRPADGDFIRALHRSSRQDLALIDGEPDFLDSLVDMQFRVLTDGLGDIHPDAAYYVIEKAGQAIGRLVLAYSEETLRVAELSFVAEARGLGYGTAILSGVQRVAALARLPVTLHVEKINLGARRAYGRLGFRPDREGPVFDRLIWIPAADDMRG